MWKKIILPMLCILLASCSNALTGLSVPSPSVTTIGTLQPDLLHFANSNCLAPCWQGITPTTDKATAERIMDGLIHYSVIGTNMRFYNGYDEKGYSVKLVYSGEKVYLTRIYPSENKPQIGVVTDFLGSPDAVCLLRSTIPDRDPEYETHIVYLHRGIWLSSNQEFGKIEGKGQLEPGLRLSEITFFSPDEKFELLEEDRTTNIRHYRQ